MSAGHDHHDRRPSHVTVDRILSNPAVQERRQWAKVDRSYDLPYLAGYSRDGKTVYIDRHLPERIDYEWNGQKRTFDPERFLKTHEEWEKAILDAMDAGYPFAHSIATAAEEREAVQAGIPLDIYRKVYAPYIKADEHERIEQLPPDLDWTPYKTAPVDRALLRRMMKVADPEKLEKTDPEVEYSDERGKPGRHCGPDSDWPENYCEYYGHHDCSKVLGYIAAKGGCNLYERADGDADD